MSQTVDQRKWVTLPDDSKIPEFEKDLTSMMKLTLDSDQLTNCMRCGFCLPACPTYRETGLEAASPRGRIALMKAVQDGLMSPDEAFRDQMDLCLGCRACEPACPAGVTYGRLLEQTRASITEHKPKSLIEKTLRRVLLKELIPSPKKLRNSMRLVSFYQKSGLQKVARTLKLTAVFPEHMSQMEKILPKIDTKGSYAQTGFSIKPKGKPIARVGMFRGCIMDVMFTETNISTVHLLVAAGYEVVFPDSQNCCGAMHAHTGEEKIAQDLARQNIRVFREAEVDYIVSNAGGCGAQLIEYPHMLKEDIEYSEDAKWFQQCVKDVSELVIERMDQLPLKLKKPVRISYQDSCHLRNGMKVTLEPRKILRSIPNADYVELFEADRCCGSAGTYSLVQPEMSMQILDHKMEHVQQTKADVLVTSNPGCLLQMKLGIERAGLSEQMRAVHLIDFLMEALDLETVEAVINGNE